MLAFLGGHPPFIRMHERRPELDAKRRRARPMFPAPPWFQNVLRQSGPAGETILQGPGIEGSAARANFASYRRIDYRCRVYGLCVLDVVGTMGSIFDHHDREQSLLLQYMQGPRDAYALRVRCVAEFSSVAHCRTQQDGQAIGMHRMCFLPSREMLEQTFACGRQLQQVCSDWGFGGVRPDSVPVVMTPWAVASTICKSLWRAVVLRVSSDMHRQTLGKLVFTSKDAQTSFVQVRERAANIDDNFPRMRNMPAGDISLGPVLESAASWIRAHSAQALQGMSDEEAQQEKTKLARLLYQCESLSRGVDPLAVRELRSREEVGWQHSALKMIQCLSVMLGVRRRQSYKEFVRKSLTAAVPESLLTTCLSYFDSACLPSDSTLSRNQAIFDAALVQLYREVFPLHNSWLYVWADASPQRHLGEMFSTEFLLIPKSAVVQCWRNALALTGLPYSPLEPPDDGVDLSELAAGSIR